VSYLHPICLLELLVGFACRFKITLDVSVFVHDVVDNVTTRNEASATQVVSALDEKIGILVHFFRHTDIVVNILCNSKFSIENFLLHVISEILMNL